MKKKQQTNKETEGRDYLDKKIGRHWHSLHTRG